MTRKKQWKCPVLAEPTMTYRRDEYGVIDWDGPRDVIEEAAGSLQHFPTRGVAWIEPEDFEFEATLKLGDMHTGRSAKWVHFEDPRTRRKFPMFIAEVLKLVREGVAQPGGIVDGRFRAVKRGQNYGIEYAGPRTEA